MELFTSAMLVAGAAGCLFLAGGMLVGSRWQKADRDEAQLSFLNQAWLLSGLISLAGAAFGGSKFMLLSRVESAFLVVFLVPLAIAFAIRNKQTRWAWLLSGISLGLISLGWIWHIAMV